MPSQAGPCESRLMLRYACGVPRGKAKRPRGLQRFTVGRACTERNLGCKIYSGPTSQIKTECGRLFVPARGYASPLIAAPVRQNRALRSCRSSRSALFRSSEGADRLCERFREAKPSRRVLDWRKVEESRGNASEIFQPHGSVIPRGGFINHLMLSFASNDDLFFIKRWHVFHQMRSNWSSAPPGHIVEH